MRRLIVVGSFVSTQVEQRGVYSKGKNLQPASVKPSRSRVLHGFTADIARSRGTTTAPQAAALPGYPDAVHWR